MEQNIRDIISQMTLEEKAGLCSGRDNWHLKAVERLGIPSVMVSDGPHGLRKQDEQGDHLGINESIKAVCFPAACAAAASFDKELMREIGRTLGEECRAENVSILLGPAINIKRSPLCGRNFEYFSEDPYLAGRMAAAEIEGVQSWSVGACLKHFAANNQEFRRMSCSSEMDERTLREIYLAGFEIAVKEAKPWTLMCSYNRINGEFASENKMLLTDILRKEWGFEGYVMSDWGAVNDRVKGLQAGLELEMPSSGGYNDKKIVEAVRNGTLDEAVLDRAAARILNITLRYQEAKCPPAGFDREAHHLKAAKAEEECAVLLKNTGILPLSKDARIAYIGGFAAAPRYQGGGSSHINASRVSSALSLAPGQVVYAQGFPAKGDESDEAAFAEAVAAAKNAEAAVIFAGLPDSFESEGYDRPHMQLPACQNELIRRIAAVQKNTVVVLHNGSPVELPWADDVSAILEMYLGGEGVGEATHALLYGDANPSGRLAETFPMKLAHNPSALNFPGDGKTVHYAEGIFVGYRYYTAKEIPVRYPFGHGLSYTSFAYSNLRLSAPLLEEDGSIIASVDVTNTGSRPGKEVVQFYVADQTGTPGRPVRELKGFEKVLLQPGETRTVSVTLDARSVQWYHEKLGCWYAASGTYAVEVCRNAEEAVLSAPMEYRSKTLPPFHVDANTTVADLLADPRTAAAAGKMLHQAMLSLGAGEQEEESADKAISNEMVRQMVINIPLRGICAFGHKGDDALNAMMDGFNRLLVP